MSLVRVLPGENYITSESRPGYVTVHQDDSTPEKRTAAEPVHQTELAYEIAQMEYRIVGLHLTIPTVSAPGAVTISIFVLLAQFLLFAIVLAALNWPLAFLICHVFRLAPDGTVHFARPMNTVAGFFLVLTPLTIPWLVFAQSYGFGIRSGDRVSKACSLVNGTVSLIVYALSLVASLLCWGAPVTDFMAQGPLAGLMIVTGIFFAKKNTCTILRGLLLFTSPMLAILVVSFVYDVWVLHLFVRSGPTGRLLVRVVLHPILFVTPIYAMRIANLRWAHDLPRTKVAVIAFATAIKLFWGRIFSSNLETLQVVAISAVLVGLGDVTWRISWPLRMWIVRHSRAGAPSPQRLELAVHYLLFERVLELALIFHTMGMFIAHRLTFPSSPVDLGFATRAMAIQLVVQLLADYVCLRMEINVLRWPVAHEWCFLRTRLFPFTMYFFFFITSVLWERGVLLLLEKTSADIRAD